MPTPTGPNQITSKPTDIPEQLRCVMCFITWPPAPPISVTGIRCGVCGNTRG